MDTKYLIWIQIFIHFSYVKFNIIINYAADEHPYLQIFAHCSDYFLRISF